MTEWSADQALAAHHDGVTVICELAAQFTEESWLAQTPCAEWRAVDLAGHLRCMADDYHEYLDEAPSSRLARLLATGVDPGKLGRKLARQNAAEIAALTDAPAAEQIAAFAGLARLYALRIRAAWDLPHHAYAGAGVTVGAMAGWVCAEWHLHAWDLARALGKDYRPARPEVLVAGWRAGVTHLPVDAAAAGRDAWHALLAASGRSPHWSPLTCG